MTVSSVPDQTKPLAPKPPPTNGASTRTFSSGTSNRRARCLRNQSMFWAVSQTVRESPSQTAVVACGSIALWFWVGVVNRRSTRCAALARAASASPLRPLMVGMPSDWLTDVARPCSAAKSTWAGSSTKSTSTSEAAYWAASRRSATTTATG